MSCLNETTGEATISTLASNPELLRAFFHDLAREINALRDEIVSLKKQADVRTGLFGLLSGVAKDDDLMRQMQETTAFDPDSSHAKLLKKGLELKKEQTDVDEVDEVEAPE